MTSIPQLRKDINDLQEKLRARDAEIAALKARDPEIVYKTIEVPKQVIKVVEKEVPGPERVVYRDGPERVVEKTIRVPEPGPERVVYRDREVPVQVIKTVHVEVPIDRIIDRIEYKDKPDTIDRLKKARAEIRKLKAELEEKPKVEYRDKIVEVPKQVIKTVPMEIPGPIRRVYIPSPERVEYRDNPKHIEMIKHLRSRLNAKV